MLAKREQLDRQGAVCRIECSIGVFARGPRRTVDMAANYCHLATNSGVRRKQCIAAGIGHLEIISPVRQACGFFVLRPTADVDVRRRRVDIRIDGGAILCRGIKRIACKRAARERATPKKGISATTEAAPLNRRLVPSHILR